MPHHYVTSFQFESGRCAVGIPVAASSKRDAVRQIKQHVAGVKDVYYVAPRDSHHWPIGDCPSCNHEGEIIPRYMQRTLSDPMELLAWTITCTHCNRTRRYPVCERDPNAGKSTERSIEWDTRNATSL